MPHIKQEKIPVKAKKAIIKFETQEEARKRKNIAIAKIERRLGSLENIMLSEAGKGRGGSGSTPKANKALREFKRLQDKISFIQFRT